MLSYFNRVRDFFCKKGSCDLKNQQNQTSKSGKHICCVCKETKQARDDCIAQNGQEQCKKFIEAHNKCLKDEGFTVEN
ncbi:Cytochrome C oxidase copper chaperone (COX17) family protein [Theileria parva strain Muguga]|uniref:Cytochrome c oxidase assembly protein, putative n=1 Tax=Theileria parva TaxID=5875 RepID=Q4MYK4_THEPA|nr:Cytochrome C oxidase copper chaperone (COX17) family protein [Theileria parva strain Muguga]EAN30678.1 Cytochrome C oxidase copper chaperone (COX17) family protein [Theileria parva strain Muguga]|eukprot:XP_762961.1 cytochrome c oxidase assembly protein [Theileria parva strain Muguga]